MWFWHYCSRFLFPLTNHRCGSDNAMRCFRYIRLIIDVVLTLLYEVFVTSAYHTCGSDIAIRGFCYSWLIIDVVMTLLYENFVTSDYSSMWFWHCYARFLLHLTNHRCVSGIAIRLFLLHLTNHRCGCDSVIRGFCYMWLIIDVVMTLLYEILVTSD